MRENASNDLLALPGIGHAGPVRKMYSSDNIGQQFVLDPRYLILEREFLFFEALDLKLIRAHGLFERKNGSVEIAMFLSQLRQRVSQHAPIAVFTHIDLWTVSFGTGGRGAPSLPVCG
jgi:hypothetical protein